MAAEHEFSFTSCVRGHHIYKKKTWTPVLGEVLMCKRETYNSKDRYAVAVVKQDDVVGLTE